MQIIDLAPEYESEYFVCLEEWSEEMKEAGDIKEKWYQRMKEKGLQVKLALDDAGKVGGMIQYTPIEQSWVLGRDLYFINCIWVHGYKQGRGDYRKRGMGTALLKAAEESAKEHHMNGIAAWGISLPWWMRASWFKKHGYIPVDKQSGVILLWKPFTEVAQPPQWIREKDPPESIPNKVTVTCYLNGWCPAFNLACKRAERAASELGDKVEFKLIDTFERSDAERHGWSDALFVNGKPIRIGPPPSYEKIKKRIARQVRKM